jgi:hypothetical protein
MTCVRSESNGHKDVRGVSYKLLCSIGMADAGSIDLRLALEIIFSGFLLVSSDTRPNTVIASPFSSSPVFQRNAVLKGGILQT